MASRSARHCSMEGRGSAQERICQAASKHDRKPRAQPLPVGQNGCRRHTAQIRGQNGCQSQTADVMRSEWLPETHGRGRIRGQNGCRSQTADDVTRPEWLQRGGTKNHRRLGQHQ